MTFNKNNNLFLVLGMLLLWTAQSFATVGFFAIGYGPRSNAMAGATVAAPQDAMVGAVNPAGLALLNDRLDFSVRSFNPIRDASLDTRSAGGNFQVSDKSAKNWFFIPGFGISKKMNDDIWLGLTVYGNGGMNTSYSRNLYDETAAVLGAASVGGASAAASVPVGAKTGIKGTGKLSVDFNQAIVAPTIAIRVLPKHWLGLSVLFGAQNFESEGLGNFQCFTPTGASNNPQACSPGNAGPLTPGFVHSKELTDNGHEWTVGLGVRVGWIGEILPQLTLGGAYTSKIFMTKFDDYGELFAENGRLDIPAHFQVGLSFKPFDDLQMTFDFQRIFYGDVKSLNNSGPVLSAFGPTLPADGGLLGTDNGLGFGWQDINIYRFGVLYRLCEKLNIRAGYSWNESPIPDDQLLFNILSPATNTKHASVGISYAINKKSRLNLTYVHAFHEGQDQSQSAFGVPASISMHQNSIDVGLSYQF